MNCFSFVNSTVCYWDLNYTVSIPYGGLIGGIYFCCGTRV